MSENEFKKLPNIRNEGKLMRSNTVHVQWRQEVKWEFTNPFSTRVHRNSKSHSENEYILMSVGGTHCTDDHRLRKIIWKKNQTQSHIRLNSDQCPIIRLCSIFSEFIDRSHTVTLWGECAELCLHLAMAYVLNAINLNQLPFVDHILNPIRMTVTLYDFRPKVIWIFAYFVKSIDWSIDITNIIKWHNNVHRK